MTRSRRVGPPGRKGGARNLCTGHLPAPGSLYLLQGCRLLRTNLAIGGQSDHPQGEHQEGGTDQAIRQVLRRIRISDRAVHGRLPVRRELGGPMSPTIPRAAQSRPTTSTMAMRLIDHSSEVGGTIGKADEGACWTGRGLRYLRRSRQYITRAYDGSRSVQENKGSCRRNPAGGF